jgi:hypothetical protein
MRGDIAHAALANDLQLTASGDQSMLSNQYQVTQSINMPQCPSCPPCGPCPSSSGSGGGSGGYGSSGAGSSGNTTGGARESFGCSTSNGASDDGPWTELVLAAFLGFALVRKTIRKRR